MTITIRDLSSAKCLAAVLALLSFTGAAFCADKKPAPNPPANESSHESKPAHSAAPVPEPADIVAGQSIDQVMAVLGTPLKTVNLACRRIYVYKDLKVTFKDGLVTDVQ
jgi:hypothetical protein